LFISGDGDSLADYFIDVLDPGSDHCAFLFGRVDAVGDLLVDFFVLELLERQLKDLTLAVLAVVEEAEVGTALVVFHSEHGLVDDWVGDAILYQRLDRPDEAVEVDR